MKKSKLKKRLRKKKHLGEFQEFGFEVTVNFDKGFNKNKFDKFRHDFIFEIEKNKLLCGGGGDYKIWEVFIISKRKFTSPTNDNRKDLKIWLENYPVVESFKIGELKDAWN